MSLSRLDRSRYRRSSSLDKLRLCVALAFIPLPEATAQLTPDCERDVTVESLSLSTSPSIDSRGGRTFISATGYGYIYLSEILPDTTVARATWSVETNLWGSRTLVTDEAVLVFWSAGAYAPPGAFVGATELATFETREPVALGSTHYLTDVVEVHGRILAALVAAEEPHPVSVVTSEDGGRSWSPPSVVGDGWDVTRSAPRFATCDGVTFLLFSPPEEPAGNTCILYKSTDLGTTWQVVRHFVEREVGITCIRLACRESTVVIAGSNFPLARAIASTNGGVTWSEPLEIEQVVDAYKCPEIAIESTGAWHLVGFANVRPDWDYGHGDLIHLVTHDGGETWSSPDTLTCHARSALRLTRHFDLSTILAGDRHYVAYQSSNLRPIVRLAWRGKLPTPPNAIASLTARPVRNPTASRGSIALRVGVPAATALHNQIFDASGRLVASWRTVGMVPGEPTVTWDATDADGSPVASGVYFWRVRSVATGESVTVRVVLI